MTTFSFSDNIREVNLYFSFFSKGSLIIIPKRSSSFLNCVPPADLNHACEPIPVEKTAPDDTKDSPSGSIMTSRWDDL